MTFIDARFTSLSTVAAERIRDVIFRTHKSIGSKDSSCCDDLTSTRIPNKDLTESTLTLRKTSGQNESVSQRSFTSNQTVVYEIHDEY